MGFASISGTVVTRWTTFSRVRPRGGKYLWGRLTQKRRNTSSNKDYFLIFKLFIRLGGYLGLKYTTRNVNISIIIRNYIYQQIVSMSVLVAACYWSNYIYLFHYPDYLFIFISFQNKKIENLKVLILVALFFEFGFDIVILRASGSI